MPKNKEHWSLWLLHGPLLKMTNGLSCPLNVLRCWLAFAPGPLRCESVPLWGVLLGPMRGWRTRTSIVRQQRAPTVRECLASAYVLRTQYSKPQWTSVHERFKQRMSPSETPLKMSCSAAQTRQRGSGSAASRPVLCASLNPLLCQKCFTLYTRTPPPHTHTPQTHIHVDRWMKKLYYRPCQFSLNYTWQWGTYSVVSRDNPLPSNRSSVKGHGFLCLQPPASAFWLWQVPSLTADGVSHV